MIQQFTLQLPAYPRGYHLITDKVMDNLPAFPKTGMLSLFIQHTSAGLCINENADPSVRVDFEQFFNHIVPENQNFVTHTMEGPDDMPAHIKAALVGSSLTIPITNHRLNLGTWQGIYLCEFRNHGGSRRIIASLYS